MSKWYPLLFKPVYQPYIWGGDRIIRHFDRDEPPGTYAESWEVSDRKEGMSVVINGDYAGRSLADLIREHGADLLGEGSQAQGFPLLIKLLDAKETLSVQVHPNDETAATYGGEAKTEMWYVLDASDEAHVYAGLKAGTNPESFKAAIANQTLDEYLNTIPVRAGDTIFMPGGRVHAVGAGCLILEVQQNSNTTYRIYDWGRVDQNGQARDLHIEQAMQVTLWEDSHSPKVTPRLLGHFEQNELWEILSCPYFRMERMCLKEEWPCAHNGESFHVLFTPDSAVDLISKDKETTRLARGRSCLIPAGLKEYTLRPIEPEATILRITA